MCKRLSHVQHSGLHIIELEIQGQVDSMKERFSSMLKTNHEHDEGDNNLRVNIINAIDTGASKHHEERKRDSGYGTDFSPASATTSRQFTFDSDIEESDFDLSDELKNMDMSNDVFLDTSITDQNENVLCQLDDVDREVEELFSESGELGQHGIKTHPVDIHSTRPVAPIPTPDEIEDEHIEHFLMPSCAHTFSVNKDTSNSEYKHSHRVQWNINRNSRKYHFRPISRSVGTQTPSPTCQKRVDFNDVLNSQRFQPYSYSNASCAWRIKRRSDEGEPGNLGPLPDIVPRPRDRSFSLPDIPSYRNPYEQDVGRELRRISDEFDSTINKEKTEQTRIQRTSSFTFNIDLVGYFTNMRLLLSSSPTEVQSHSPDDTPE